MKKLISPILALSLLAIVMLFQVQTPKLVLTEDPGRHLREIEGFVSESVAPGEAELNVLPADTRIEKRLYTDEYGRWFQVSLIVGGHSKGSIHRPELCLPAQGFQMKEPKNIEAGGANWHTIKLDRGVYGSLGFAYTFFNQAGFHTSSHTRRILQDVWDRSILSRIDRWHMVTVNAYSADEKALSSFLTKLKEVVE